MIALPKSLSVRLLLLFIASGFVIVAALSFLFSYGISTEWRQQIRPHLAQYVNYVREDLGNPPSPERANELAATLPVDIHIFKSGKSIHSTNDQTFNPNDYRFSVPNRRYDDDAAKYQQQNASRSHFPSLEFARRRHHSVVKIPMAEHNVFIELDRELGARRSQRFHLWFIPLVLAGLLGALYGLLRRLLSPISDIKSGVATMSAGDLSHNIPIRRNDDLGQLAGSVNGLSTQINQLLDAKRQLLLSVSHELRSPITRAHIAAELMPNSVNRERVLDELRLLDSLIESLMESERLQSEHSVLNLSIVDIHEIVQNCIADLQAEYVNELSQITVSVADGLNPELNGDEVRLRLLCRNLLNNAVQYGKSVEEISSKSQARIQVNIAGTADTIECTFSDEGPGVDDADIDALTDPFYRPDTSRTHGKGGVGLGLSLAKLIAEAHGGSLTLAHRADGRTGLCVKVILSRTL